MEHFSKPKLLYKRLQIKIIQIIKSNINSDTMESIL